LVELLPDIQRRTLNVQRPTLNADGATNCAILTALTSIFIVATIAAKIRGLDITCGCFGHASKNWSFTTHLALDLVLLDALLLVVRQSTEIKTLRDHSRVDTNLMIA